MNVGDEFWKIEVRENSSDPRGCSFYGSNHVDICSLFASSEFLARSNAIVALSWIRDIDGRSGRSTEQKSDGYLITSSPGSDRHYAVVRWLRVSDSRSIRAPFELTNVAATLTLNDKRVIEHALCAAMARELAIPRSPKGANGSVYEVVDDDGRMLVLASGFADAIETWRAKIHAENPDSDMTTYQPTKVVRLCEPNEFLYSPEVDLG